MPNRSGIRCGPRRGAGRRPEARRSSRRPGRSSRPASGRTATDRRARGVGQVAATESSERDRDLAEVCEGPLVGDVPQILQRDPGHGTRAASDLTGAQAARGTNGPSVGEPRRLVGQPLPLPVSQAEGSSLTDWKSKCSVVNTLITSDQARGALPPTAGGASDPVELRTRADADEDGSCRGTPGAVLVEEAPDEIGPGLHPELVEMGGGAGDVHVTLPASGPTVDPAFPGVESFRRARGRASLVIEAPRDRH